jgi:polyvinyl alcohol dehydrogenase (cytochrome)
VRGRSRTALPGALVAACLALVLAPVARAQPDPAQAPGRVQLHESSEWPCGHWGMYGRTMGREFSTDCPTGIDPTTVVGLVPAWTFRPPPTLDLESATFTASPAVVDGVVYIGAWDGVMYALDADDGSLLWSYRTRSAPGAAFGPIVSSAAVAEARIRGQHRRLVIFGAGPFLYALDAHDGSEVWVTGVGSGDPDDVAQVESSPLVHGRTVYVGMDVHNKPGDRTGGVRGGMLAIDVRTGSVIWKFSSEEHAGQPASGCGGVWGSPALDADTGLLYFGTANCPAVNGNPDLPMEEVTALVARTGEHVWTFRPHEPPDVDDDFGATPNLFRDANGRLVLGAANKDGDYYALDPASGELLWHTDVVDPVPGVGGFIGSPAVWDGKIFGGTAIGTPPYYHSLDGATGAVRWQGIAAPTYAASSVANGVVLAGALDGLLKAFDAETGRLLWASPLLGPISSGPAIVGDMVVVGSGTSSSDLCAKDDPWSEACFLAFDTVLGQQGGVHAFRLATSLLPMP